MQKAFGQWEAEDISGDWVDLSTFADEFSGRSAPGLFEFSTSPKIDADPFSSCLAFVLKWEGGYSNNPKDSAGATMKGITQAVYNQWRRSQGKPVESVRDIAFSDVREIYRRRYWLLSKAYLLPEPLDLVHFDTAVNMGVGGAAKVLQSALGVVVDGVIGPKTMQAVADICSGTGGVRVLARSYLCAKEARYLAIVKESPDQKEFLEGWLNRLESLRKQAGLTT